MARHKPDALDVVGRVFPIGHFAVSVLFIACAFSLIGFSCLVLWQSLQPGDMTMTDRRDGVLEALAIITVSLAALELGETIIEEEIRREAHMSAPTRVRRFLSRFMVVLVVALVIESLVLIFKFSHSAPENMPYAVLPAFAAAALTTAWGVFIRLNRSAEELEPEAMREAKDEDRKMNVK
jgi:uncharacterized paraquat-inducible protein A